MQNQDLGFNEIWIWWLGQSIVGAEGDGCLLLKAQLSICSLWLRSGVIFLFLIFFLCFQTLNPSLSLTEVSFETDFLWLSLMAVPN